MDNEKIAQIEHLGAIAERTRILKIIDELVTSQNNKIEKDDLTYEDTLVDMNDVAKELKEKINEN